MDLFNSLAEKKDLRRHLERDLCQSRFSKRPIFLEGCLPFTFSADLEVLLPAYFSPEKEKESLRDFALHILNMGYNALICGRLPTKAKQKHETYFAFDDEVLEKLNFLESLGLQVYLKVDAEEPVSLSEFSEFSKGMGIFWEAQALKKVDPEQAEFLDFDLFQAELLDLESHLLPEQELLYFLPAWNYLQAKDHCHFFQSLTANLGKNSTLVFPEHLGALRKESQQEHPIWDYFPTWPYASGAPMMPCLNLAASPSNLGLWPNFPFEFFEETFPKMRRHAFLGAIALSSSLPKKGTYLDFMLRIFAQYQATSLNLSELLDIHLGDLFETLSKKESLAALRELRGIYLSYRQAKDLPVEDEKEKARFRMEIESLLKRLDLLRCLHGKEAYFLFFVRDLKRLAFLLLQERQLPMANVLEGEDLKESFWTEVPQMSSKGFGAALKIQHLEEANQGQEGSALRAIYEATVASY